MQKMRNPFTGLGIFFFFFFEDDLNLSVIIASLCSHPAGRCPNNSSLNPPLAAVIVVAPEGGAKGNPGFSSIYPL